MISSIISLLDHWCVAAPEEQFPLFGDEKNGVQSKNSASSIFG